MSARIIFAGTPDFAAEHLKALLDAGIIPVAVYTQPDRPCGRGHKLKPSPVKTLALQHGIEVRTPLNFKAQADIDAFAALNTDLAIVVAYGLILPEPILKAPKCGCINVHGSLLPRWRGAAPIQRALLAGDAESGVTIIKLVKKLDAGAMLAKAEVPIEDDDTSESLYVKLAKAGSELLVKTVPQILSQQLTGIKQDESLTTYAHKLTREESMLDFNTPAKVLELKVRGLYPWPVAVLSAGDTNFKIFKAKAVEGHGAPGTILDITKEGIIIACAEGALRLEVIQAPGKGQVKAADFARSHAQIFSRGISLAKKL